MKRKTMKRFAMLLSVCLMLCLLGCSAGESGGKHKGGSGKVIKIQTAYIPLEFPAEYEANLKYEERVVSGRTEEHFYMIQGDIFVELFCVCFGDETEGSLIGYLHMDSGVVPLTLQVFDKTEEMDEDAENLYFGMMEGVNTILDSVYADKRFSEHSDFNPGDRAKATMKYWSVSLPENVTYEEIIEDDLYRVVFYGNVASSRIKLYSVSIGDEAAENPLGTIEIDGERKTVSVKVEGLSQMNTLSEEDLDIAYSLMDSINDVVAAIMSNDNFVAQEVEM